MRKWRRLRTPKWHAQDHRVSGRIRQQPSSGSGPYSCEHYGLLPPRLMFVTWLLTKPVVLKGGSQTRGTTAPKNLLEMQIPGPQPWTFWFRESGVESRNLYCQVLQIFLTFADVWDYLTRTRAGDFFSVKALDFRPCRARGKMEAVT